MAARDTPLQVGTGEDRCTNDGALGEPGVESPIHGMDQLAYLTLWMKQSAETRREWEKAEPNEEHDVVILSGKIQELDVQLGEGATVSCIRSQLVAWGKGEPEQTENEEKAPDAPQLRILGT